MEEKGRQWWEPWLIFAHFDACVQRVVALKITAKMVIFWSWHWLAVLFDVKTFPLVENSQVSLLAHGCMWYRHAQVSTGQKIPKRAQTINVAVTFIWLWWRLLDLSEVYGGHGFSIVLQRFFNTSQCILILLRNKILQQLIASIAWKWRHVLNMVKL